MQNNDQDIL